MIRHQVKEINLLHRAAWFLNSDSPIDYSNKCDAQCEWTPANPVKDRTLDRMLSRVTPSEHRQVDLNPQRDSSLQRADLPWFQHRDSEHCLLDRRV